MNLSEISRSSKFVGAIDRLMEALWLVLIFVLPLVFFSNIFTTFELAKVFVFKAGVVMLFLLWVLKYFILNASPRFRSKSDRHEPFSFTTASVRSPEIFLGFFLGWYVLATLFSVAPDLSFFGWYPRFQGLYTMFYYVLFGMVVFFELRSREQKNRLQLVLMVSLILVCFVALLQKFLPGFFQWWNDAAFNGRIYGTMANPNYLASYIVMILPLSASFLMKKKHKIVAGSALVLGLVSLIFTLSRAGFLAAFLGLLFFGVMVAYRKHAKKTLVVLGILPLFVGGFVWYLIGHPQEAWIKNIPFLERLTTNEENVSSAQTRLEIWPATVKQILASPVFGYGPETFAVTFPVFAPADVNTSEDQGEIIDHPHNEILDVAVQVGIPGMIAYLCFILGLILEGVFVVKENNEETFWLIAGLASSILGLFVANEFGFSVTVNWVLLVTFAALILNTVQQQHLEPEKFDLNPILKWSLFGVLAVLSVGMFLMHDVGMILADAKMRDTWNAAPGLSAAIDTVGFTPEVSAQLKQSNDELRTAMRLAPTEAFYALYFARNQISLLYDGQKLSAVEKSGIFNSAFHAARLRGYDGFSLSVVGDLKKFED